MRKDTYPNFISRKENDPESPTMFFVGDGDDGMKITDFLSSIYSLVSFCKEIKSPRLRHVIVFDNLQLYEEYWKYYTGTPEEEIFFYVELNRVKFLMLHKFLHTFGVKGFEFYFADVFSPTAGYEEKVIVTGVNYPSEVDTFVVDNDHLV